MRTRGPGRLGGARATGSGSGRGRRSRRRRTLGCTPRRGTCPKGKRRTARPTGRGRWSRSAAAAARERGRRPPPRAPVPQCRLRHRRVRRRERRAAAALAASPRSRPRLAVVLVVLLQPLRRRRAVERRVIEQRHTLGAHKLRPARGSGRSATTSTRAGRAAGGARRRLARQLRPRGRRRLVTARRASPAPQLQLAESRDRSHRARYSVLLGNELGAPAEVDNDRMWMLRGGCCRRGGSGRSRAWRTTSSTSRAGEAVSAMRRPAPTARRSRGRTGTATFAPSSCPAPVVADLPRPLRAQRVRELRQPHQHAAASHRPVVRRVRAGGTPAPTARRGAPAPQLAVAPRTGSLLSFLSSTPAGNAATLDDGGPAGGRALRLRPAPAALRAAAAAAAAAAGGRRRRHGARRTPKADGGHLGDGRTAAATTSKASSATATTTPTRATAAATTRRGAAGCRRRFTAAAEVRPWACRRPASLYVPPSLCSGARRRRA